jgi:hypothetical protein
MDNFAINLVLTVEQMNKILTGLSLMPYRESVDLIQMLKAEGDQQLKEHQQKTVD